MVINKLFTALVCYLAMTSMQVFASATATVDRTSINLAETFQLTLTLDEQSIFDKPDISVLDNDFTVLGQQKSSQSSWINGEKSAKTQWIYQLAPKKSGTLTIPAIDIDGEKTQALSIKVNAGSNNPDSAGNLQPVFMEAVVDKESLYVQEQLLLTLRINSSLNLHNLQLEELKIDNAFIVQVSNTNYERQLNNIPYITYEVVYAIFPQTSGDLSIPAIAAAGINPGRSSFNSLFSGGNNIRVQSDALTVTVNEIPAQLGSSLWLPAKSLNIRETWSADPENIQVGDSITRTITTTATGLSAEQLPPVTMPADRLYKTYPDQPNFSDAKNNDGIVGERQDAIALVATQPGEVTLPAISVQWWDIEAKALKTATLPEVVIKIVGGSGAASGATTTPQTNTPGIATAPVAQAPVTSTLPAAGQDTATGHSHSANVLPWQIATGISSAIALLLMVLFVVSKAKPVAKNTSAPLEENNSTKVLLQSLKSACASNNVADIRSLLLAWARLNWPHARIHATADLHHLLQDENIRAWTKRIDANLYTADKSQENWLDFYTLVAQKQDAMNQGKTGKLQPLYPV